MRNFLRRWGPALLMMIVIFIGSSVPGEDFPQYEGIWDFVVKKSGHLLEYGLLAVLILRGVAWPLGQGAAGLPARSQLLAALGLTVLYACTDELHQRFTPGRGGVPVDVAIDFLGGCLGLGLAYGWQVIRQTRSQSPRSHSTPPRA